MRSIIEQIEVAKKPVEANSEAKLQKDVLIVSRKFINNTNFFYYQEYIFIR